MGQHGSPLASTRGAVDPLLWTMCLAMLAAAAVGAPILGPDLNSCRPIIPPRRTEAEAVECCLIDTGRPIVDFKYDTNLPMRVRRPVHKLDEDFIRKYKRAYEIMRALPPDDPRSFHAQANIHCSYCAQAYSQFNSTEALDVHHGWLLMPFHRWFMYFHERILASLIGDDTFAIPYWAWDVQNETSPPANIMPDIFTDVNSPLYDPLRCHIHMPPHRVDLRIQVEPHNKPPQQLYRNNHYNMWRVMIGEVQAPESFFGGKYAHGYAVIGRAGRFETGPHAAVHGWTGDETTVFGEDMAPAYSAARDPIFFSHHSQVDRLWMMWRDLGHRDLDDPDWLDTEFLFYDENSEMVRVNIRGCLNITKLGISYEQVPAEWLEYTPRSIRRSEARRSAGKSITENLWSSFWQVFNGEKSLLTLFGKPLGEPKKVLGAGAGARAVLSSEVHRPDPRAKDSMMKKSDASVLDEVLVIEGVVTKPFQIKVLVNVFLALPEADKDTPLDCAESLGSIYIEPEGRRRADEVIVSRQFSQKIGIGSRFHFLGIIDATSVSVTFVPAWDKTYDHHVSVEFTELKIELQKVR